MLELSELIHRANSYFDDAARERPPPERLDYVHVPKTAAEAEAARKIARAVGDAQVCLKLASVPHVLLSCDDVS